MRGAWDVVLRSGAGRAICNPVDASGIGHPDHDELSTASSKTVPECISSDSARQPGARISPARIAAGHRNLSARGLVGSDSGGASLRLVLLPLGFDQRPLLLVACGFGLFKSFGSPRVESVFRAQRLRQVHEFDPCPAARE